MIIIGIDPGQSGGIAFLDSQGTVIATSKLSQTEADVVADIRSVIEDETWKHHFAFIEQVHAMPKQGVTSSFKFGQSYGFLIGLLTGMHIPYEQVTPQKWQKSMSCLTKGDKNVSKSAAQRLFPKEKITHAIADALLIAEYGRRVLSGRTPE